MEEFKVKLNLLVESLITKIQYQKQVLSITENQELILKNNNANNLDAENYIREMNLEKSNIIEEIISCDTVFNSIFEKLDIDFEKNAQTYKDDIKNLQEYIKQTMDIDIKIRVLEDKNKTLYDNVIKSTKSIVSDKSKKLLLQKYNKNNKR